MVKSKRAPRVLWITPRYLPWDKGGGEHTVHALNRYLMEKKGYRVAVASADLSNSSFEGVEIRALLGTSDLRAMIEESSLVLTQLDHSDLGILLARSCGKPLVHFVQDPGRVPPQLFSPQALTRQYVIYIAEWIGNSLRLPHPSIVVRPPVDWRDYQVETNHRCITLINVNRNKGGAVLVELARRMPDKMFLGVIGAYGRAIIEEGLPNLAYRPYTEHIRQVYAETHVLLMPSLAENWGRTGVEAMSSGIPVIAHPAAGLRESLSYAGLFCDRQNIDDWVRTLRALDSPEYYREVAARCAQRSRELDPAEDLKRLGDFLDQILGA